MFSILGISAAFGKATMTRTVNKVRTIIKREEKGSDTDSEDATDRGEQKKTKTQTCIHIDRLHDGGRENIILIPSDFWYYSTLKSCDCWGIGWPTVWLAGGWVGAWPCDCLLECRISSHQKFDVQLRTGTFRQFAVLCSFLDVYLYKILDC